MVSIPFLITLYFLADIISFGNFQAAAPAPLAAARRNRRMRGIYGFRCSAFHRRSDHLRRRRYPYPHDHRPWLGRKEIIRQNQKAPCFTVLLFCFCVRIRAGWLLRNPDRIPHRGGAEERLRELRE